MTAMPTAVEMAETTAPVDEPVRARRAPRPRVLLVVSILVAVVLLAPLVFLLIEAGSAGADTIYHLIFRPLTATLLWNTVRLTVDGKTYT